MRLLLDSCVVVWLTVDISKVPAAIQRVIEEADTVFVSPLTFVEIAFKERTGQKITLPVAELRRFLEEDEGFTLIPFDADAAETFHALEWHHKDPFDRMLVSQAIAHDLTFVTPDEWVPKYNCKVLW